jgi:cysteine desulfurase
MKLGQLEFLKYVFRSKRQVYLDHNATTSVSRRVRHTVNRILKHHYGNPSSLYKIVRKSAGLIEQARHRVADAIHSDPLEICFTGSATESNNAVLKSLSTYFLPKKKTIISTPIEHHSVVNTLEYLKTQGITVEYCPVDRWGRVLLPELEKKFDEDTFLLCCVLANNETGVIQDIAAITRMAHQHDVLVLADCVEALGKIPVDVHEWGIDYASFSGAQAARAERRRRLVRQAGKSVHGVIAWRASGKRDAGRHRKCPQHCRIWRSLQGCGQAAGSFEPDPCFEE